MKKAVPKNRTPATTAAASREPDAFKEFELNGWQQSTTGYHQGFGPLTAQTVEAMLGSLRVSKGCRLLDMATGPGYLAARAETLGAVTTGLGFSEEMLAGAEGRFRNGAGLAIPMPAVIYAAQKVIAACWNTAKAAQPS